jgi:hypothetical protein
MCFEMGRAIAPTAGTERMWKYQTSFGQSRPPSLKLTAAGEAAIAADKLWFAQNPDKTRRQRRVRQCELPVELRDRNITEVLIERVGPSWLLRTLLDRNGKAVAGGWEMYEAPIVPDAPDATVNRTCNSRRSRLRM